MKVTDPAIFDSCLEALRDFRRGPGKHTKGRFTQMFLGLKYYQDELPSMHSGSFVGTDVLQTLLDDLFAKDSRPLTECVLVLFEKNFLARTGVTGAGRSGPQNTWRNNFNIQKGIGCYADPADLASNAFLNEPRSQCRYLVPGPTGGLKGGECSLCPGGKYRQESHRKWLRIDPGGNGYAVVDMMNTSNFVPYVAPEGVRIPIVPLLGAIYHDPLPGLSIWGNTNVDLDKFMADFNFSPNEFVEYFEDSPKDPFNDRVLKAHPSISYTPISRLSKGKAATAKAAKRAASKKKAGGSAIPTSTTVPSGNNVPPPGVNTGWDAEQFIIRLLRDDGWEVHDVSRNRMGFDLMAKKKGRGERFIDVKSSLGMCSPSLTQREWQQASKHRSKYVLAIIENFNPSTGNVVYWVGDPATNCAAYQSTTINYSIPRYQWQAAVVMLGSM